MSPDYESETLQHTILDALTRKGVDAHQTGCVACGRRDAGMVLGASVRLTVLDARTGEPADPPASVEAALIVCSHCGLLQLHGMKSLISD